MAGLLTHIFTKNAFPLLQKTVAYAISASFEGVIHIKKRYLQQRVLSRIYTGFPLNHQPQSVVIPLTAQK